MSDTAPNAAIHDAWRPRANPWLIALVVTMAPFMEILDSTIVNVSLPHIAGSMSASIQDATWTLTSYLLANGIVLPISAWLSDFFGRRRFFLACIAMFTVCSFLCGIATSLWQLILFRLLQGFFGGGLQPSQQSILLDTFPIAQRAKAFGMTAMAVVVGPVIGPTLGGFITDNFSWRWIFLINVPIGIIAFFLSALMVEDPPWAALRKRALDGIGLGLLVIGLGCLQVTLDRGQDLDWFDSGFIQTTASIAAVCLIGAVLWLIYTPNPILRVTLMKDRHFALGCLMMGCMSMMLYASSILIPQMAQLVLGYDATWAGLILSPGGLVAVSCIPIVGFIATRVQLRVLVAVGFTILSFAMFQAHRWPPNVDFKTLVEVRLLQVFGLSFLFVPISSLAYIRMPRIYNNDGSALYAVVRNVMGSIGIALVSSRVERYQQGYMFHMSKHLSPLDSGYAIEMPRLVAGAMRLHQPVAAVAGHIYQTLVNQAITRAYGDVYLRCTVLSLMMVPLCLLYSNVRSSGKRAPGGH